jgi:LmbE family N-acetylglucosaminyl deacetylase
MSQSEPSSLRLLAIGAHPDDCEIKVGGLAALYRQAGHEVCFVSVTNGQSGHQSMYGEQLAAIRCEEAQASGRVIGVQYEVLDHPDGYLQPTPEIRSEIIRIIRRYEPDLVVTHRPNDYHPDHRYTSQLVCDAAYMLTVPAIARDVPALASDPVVMYMSDDFQRPYPFSPSVVLDIESVLDTLLDMLACHQSQVFDWLPCNRGILEQVPHEPGARRQWLRDWYLSIAAPLAEKYRELLIETYGEERGREIRYIEAYETCEYGSPLTPEASKRLFPFATGLSIGTRPQ